jgi:hypothetical protein
MMILNKVQTGFEGVKKEEKKNESNINKTTDIGNEWERLSL